jgi:hypothetical protein
MKKPDIEGRSFDETGVFHVNIALDDFSKTTHRVGYWGHQTQRSAL